MNDMKHKHKLAQRQTHIKGYDISVALTGDIGYLMIADQNLYPDHDSRSERRDKGYSTFMVPLMTREALEDLHTAIGEVLKYSK
jgi:hypothetical protein